MDTTLAVVVGFITPFLYKVIPLKGLAMVAFTWVAAFVLAGADLFVTGGTAGWTLQNIATEFAKLYAVQTGTFAVFSNAAPATVK
jgi:hypothetical protein